MNRAQRIVLVIALGIALFAIAGVLNLVLLDFGPDWFAYAPNSGTTMSRTDSYFVVADDEAILRQAAIWLLALTTWAGASLWLLRTRTPTGDAE